MQLRFETTVKYKMRREGLIVEILKQKYTLLEQIGSSPNCVVYRAEHKKLKQVCAIKCILKKETKSKIFLKEAEFLRNLNNFFIPILYDFEEDERYWYLIEEYIIGQSLWDLRQSQKFISVNKLIDVSIMMCQAIEWLHERKPYPILYLDLKPEHVVLTGGGMKLLDFGSAVYLRDGGISGTITGTKGFASPEQLRGDVVDERSDVYSIGAVIYWMMTGETPDCTGCVKKIKGYSKEWSTIINECTKPYKEERYASVQALQKAIQSIRKNKEERQFHQSLKIAVTGSQNRIGVTHFSIGLSIACENLGFPCLYEEKNDSGTIEEIFQQMGRIKEKNGIYYFPDFKAIPKYGKAISDEISEEQIFVRDYGVFREEDVPEFLEADCVIVIAGGKEWELRRTRELLERYKQRNNTYYVLCMGGFLGFKALSRELHLNKAFQMPCYENPFVLEKKARRFYKILWRRIIADMTRSMTDGEAAWKKRKLYVNHWSSRGR